jgi:hypothetical protein
MIHEPGLSRGLAGAMLNYKSEKSAAIKSNKIIILGRVLCSLTLSATAGQ